MVLWKFEYSGAYAVEPVSPPIDGELTGYAVLYRSLRPNRLFPRLFFTECSQPESPRQLID